VQDRNVILLLDNFSGHSMAYRPTNVRVEFFEPNLTSHVQPLDAGIIRCFKAKYRGRFCMHALAADDAGESEIWKITIKDAMEMATEAWDEVTAETIQNYWAHMGILPQSDNGTRMQGDSTADGTGVEVGNEAQEKAWALILDFLTNNNSLPEAEAQLQQVLGQAATQDTIWTKALSIANDCEDEDTAINSARQQLTELRVTAHSFAIPGPGNRPPATNPATDPDTEAAVVELQNKIHQLKARNRIWDVMGAAEFIAPPEESERAASASMPSDDYIAAKVTEAAYEAEPDVLDSDSDDEDSPAESAVSVGEMLQFCDQIAAGCRQHGVGSGLALQHQLFALKIELRHIQNSSKVQRRVDNYFKARGSVGDAMAVDKELPGFVRL